MARIANYCIDRYEAHLVEAPASGDQRSHPHYDRPAAGTRYEARSAPDLYPQAYVSRDEANSACTNAGKRLCTVQEWHRACRGIKDQTYPYGPRFIQGRCNSSKPHLLTRLFGPDPRSWKYDEHFNGPAVNQEPGFLARTGEYSTCATDAAVYDMVGNLHEWVSDTAGPSLAVKIPLTSGIRRRLRRNAGHGIFMGGFYSTTSEHGHGCGFVTVAHEPGYHDYSTGFRCCLDRELR
jgi:sulfatase modifying factor 1